MINLFQPSLSAKELSAVQKVFESNWVGKGSVTDQFESRFAEYQNVDPTLMRSISCCTEGLFQAIELLDIGPGDEVILPTISFVGAANAIAASGARPVFCDVDVRTLNTTASLIDQKITPKTKAVVLMHYGGVPCEMDEICQLVDLRGIALVEDSAAGVASRYRDRACGTFGDIGVWSFDAMKILVTGDGGMVYSRTEQLSRRLERKTYLGLMQPSGFANRDDVNWWEFEICTYGRRAIMNDIASAIGIEQLKQLSDNIARRREVHRMYHDALADMSWLDIPPAIPSYMESSHYFYWVQLKQGLRDQLARYLRKHNIYTSFRYYPLHLVKQYGHATPLRNAEVAGVSTLCLPMHQSLSDADVDQVASRIREFGMKYAQGG